MHDSPLPGTHPRRSRFALGSAPRMGVAALLALGLGASVAACGGSGSAGAGGAASGTGGASASSGAGGAATTASSGGSTGSSTSGGGGAASSTGTGNHGGGGGSAASDVRVLTGHNDNAHTGANLKETELTTSNVDASQFGLLFTRPVDDQIYAQPLYLPGVAMPGKGTHNVVFTATMNDSVYAFDADDKAALDPLWKVSFLVNGAAPVFHTDVGSACGAYNDISGNIGILSTPVIDEATNTIYVVPKTKEKGKQVYRLHALDLTTGAERPNSPVDIQASVAGTGDGSVGGMVTFDPAIENQRAGLILANGRIYIGFAGYCDTGKYHGWLLAYDPTTLKQTNVYNVTPNGWAGGIWMSGQGPSVDADGKVFLVTGNGTFDGNDGKNYGNSVLALDPGLTLKDWFTPHNQQMLNDGDLDLGSGGALLVPGTTYLVTGGKGGDLYILDRDALSHYSPTGDNIVQSFHVSNNHIHGSPVAWDLPGQTMIYVWAEYGYLSSFQLAGGKFTAGTKSTSPAPDGMPGGMLSLSANGTTPGSAIVWAVHPFVGDANQAVRPGVLKAFDASNLGKLLWDSHMKSARDDFGSFAKFAPPTIANGKVYLATFSNQLAVYGHGDFAGPCYNNTLDAGETGIDCGGSCAPCVAKTLACPSNGSMFTGQVFDCDLGATRDLLGIDLSVGCNDAETGVYSVSFDQGPAMPLAGACATSLPLAGVASRFVHLTMKSGGGTDNQISFQGWSVSHD